jgi:hypothetical protein
MNRENGERLFITVMALIVAVMLALAVYGLVWGLQPWR